MADNTITTRTSQPTRKKTAEVLESYTSQNLLSEVWPVIRGRRWATGFAISGAFGVFSRTESSGGK